MRGIARLLAVIAISLVASLAAAGVASAAEYYRSSHYTLDNCLRAGDFWMGYQSPSGRGTVDRFRCSSPSSHSRSRPFDLFLHYRPDRPV